MVSIYAFACLCSKMRDSRVLLIHNDGALSQSMILLCVSPADLNSTEEGSVNA